MKNKFSRTQSRILIYGKEHNYKVVECNCLEDVEEVIECWGKPNVYMKNFNTWQEMATARKCYEWQMSAFPSAKKCDEKPTDKEDDWFWKKQLDDEYIVKDVREIVAKWDPALPDSPDAYRSSIENLKNENFFTKFFK